MSDQFGDYIEDKKERKESKFKKTQFLELKDGTESTVRILDPHEVKHYTHYMGWVYVQCLGEDCPICLNNKKIMYEHPEDYRDVRGWTPRRDRYYINVLDRTQTKVCVKCETENSATAELCSGCGAVLGAAKPLEKVKVLSGSSKLFEDLKVLSKTVRDENDERVDIRTYDWLLITRGQKREKVTNVSPRYFPNKAGLLEVPAEELYDLQNAVIHLDADEMMDVFNGHSLKDVFAIRRAKKQAMNAEFEPTEQLRKDIDDSVDEIFKQ